MNGFADNSRISIGAYLNVVLVDLPWDPNFAVEGSNEYDSLVEQFNNQVGFVFCLRLSFNESYLRTGIL